MISKGILEEVREAVGTKLTNDSRSMPPRGDVPKCSTSEGEITSAGPSPFASFETGEKYRSGSST